MITLIQIALVLVLISLVGIILGYILGKFRCKREQNDYYFEKGGICEESYKDKLLENENTEEKDESNSLDSENRDNNSSVSSGDSTISKENDVNSSDTINDINSTPQGLISTIKDDETSSEDEDIVKPEVYTKPLEDKDPDNLCRIKGIGNVIDGKLKALGIYYFDQISKWSEKEISWIDEHLAFKGRVVREKWVEQAELLAKGEETEFSQRVDKGEVESSKKS